LAWNPSIRTAVADLAGRLRIRVKSLHGSLGRELQHILDESESPSCCAQATVEGVKSLVSSEPAEPTPRDRESGPK
jgi:hypothetical protein